MNIALIDYGMGNIKSVENALRFLKFDPCVCIHADQVNDAQVLILPGVGAFGQGMEELRKRGFDGVIKEHIASGKPFLGICLGLQLLFERGFEEGEHQGLGIFKGEAVPFSPDLKLKIPHMGWNQLDVVKDNSLFNDISKDSYFYFVHSYYVVPEDRSLIAATTDYGEPFCSMIATDTVISIVDVCSNISLTDGKLGPFIVPSAKISV